MELGLVGRGVVNIVNYNSIIKSVFLLREIGITFSKYIVIISIRERNT